MDRCNIRHNVSWTDAFSITISPPERDSRLKAGAANVRLICMATISSTWAPRDRDRKSVVVPLVQSTDSATELCVIILGRGGGGGGGVLDMQRVVADLRSLWSRTLGLGFRVE